MVARPLDAPDVYVYQYISVRQDAGGVKIVVRGSGLEVVIEIHEK